MLTDNRTRPVTSGHLIYLAVNNGTKNRNVVKGKQQEQEERVIVPCFNVKWPLLLAAILELSICPGGSGKDNRASHLCAVVICRQNTGELFQRANGDQTSSVAQ